MNSKDIKLSKSLSWLLRHGATKEGLTFNEGGFIDVESVLKLRQFRNYNKEDIKRVSETNEKKRFAMRYIGNDTLQIRANQGHSLELDENSLLTLLSKETVPSPVYHGTYFDNLPSILENGLNRMSRNHIHFTPKFPGDAGIVSGMRQNCQVFVVVDALVACSDGFKFYESENGVILCPGNEQGVLPSSYIKQIWKMSPLEKVK